MVWELKDETEIEMRYEDFCAAVRDVRRRYSTRERSTRNFYDELEEGVIEYYGDGKRYVVTARRSKGLLGEWKWNVKVQAYGRPDTPPDLGSIS